MDKLSILLVVATIFSLVSGAYNPRDDKEIKFTVDGSEDYDFQYKLDNDDIYSGKTYHVHGKLYFLFAPNNVIYGVEINKDEIKNKIKFTKIAHIVERKGNSFYVKGDLNKYVLDINENYFSVTPYETEWDLEHVCFSRLNPVDLAFKFTILSSNNARKYTDITYSDDDDPLSQRIHLQDGTRHDAIYEIEFTEDELTYNRDFCRKVTRRISARKALGSSKVAYINPSLLRPLISRLQ